MTIPAARLLFHIADTGPLVYDYGAEPVDRRLIDAVVAGLFCGEREVAGRRRLVLSPLGWEAVRHARRHEQPDVVLAVRLRPYTDRIRKKSSDKERRWFSVRSSFYDQVRDAAIRGGESITTVASRVINAALDKAGAA